MEKNEIFKEDKNDKLQDENRKYVKVMFGTSSGANGFEYKIGEINIADYWNPTAENPKDMGGFNFSVEDKIIRWLIRGDTIYDVEIPEDAEVIDVPHPSTPHGVFRSNKIIIKNPRAITDDMAMELYKKSTIPEKTYYKAMVGCAIRGFMNTAIQILNDRVSRENVEVAISEFIDFCTNRDTGIFNENELGPNTRRIYDELLKIKK